MKEEEASTEDLPNRAAPTRVVMSVRRRQRARDSKIQTNEEENKKLYLV